MMLTRRARKFFRREHDAAGLDLGRLGLVGPVPFEDFLIRHSDSSHDRSLTLIRPDPYTRALDIDQRTRRCRQPEVRASHTTGVGQPSRSEASSQSCDRVQQVKRGKQHHEAKGHEQPRPR